MRKLAAAWVALQVLFLAGWSWREQGRSAEGTTILVRPEPIDPRDLLRGQYLELAYAFSRAGLPGVEAPPEPLASGDTVWALLAEEGGFHVPRAFGSARPEEAAGEVALRGRVENGRHVFGIERYYVPEGSPTPSPEDTIVKLRVGPDGGARIETLLVNGSPWP